MSTQPEALRLAALLDASHFGTSAHPVAAELRRLHGAHDWQYKMAGERLRRIEKLEALNAELVEALQWIADCRTGGLIEGKARAALAKVEASNGS